MLGSFGFHWRSGPPEHRPVAPGGARGPARRPRAGARARGRRRWCRLARADARHGARQPQEPGLARRAGSGARRRRTASTSGSGTSSSSPTRASAASSAVGQASATPPRLIRLDYAPPKAGRRTPTVVLVGKGITFDTGGLSIKPGEAMVNMKRDMTGGAVVLATMAALGAVGCPVRVIGLVPAAENAVGGNALRPGDVVRHYGGRTTRGHQHRRRGPAGARRRAGVRRRRAQARRRRRRRHPDRRDEGRAGPAGRRLLRQRRRARRA